MIQRAAVFGDNHIPDHDNPLWYLFLEWLRDNKIHKVYINGDFWDIYCLNRFSRHPSKGKLLKDEMELGIQMLEDELLPICNNVEFILGNHEYRVERYLTETAPELWGLDGIDFKKFAQLDRLGIKYHDLGTWLGKLYVTHGHLVRPKGGYSASAHIEHYHHNVLVNHVHRMGSSAKRIHDKTICGWENGCMLDLKADYLKRKGGFANWQHGWSMVEIDKTDAFAVYPVHVARDYTFVSFGKLYKG
jgi:predicted phosphodiesterase